MIERWLNPILQPIWKIKGKILGIKNTKANIQMDAKRLKGYAADAKGQAAALQAKGKELQGKGQAMAAQGQAAAGQAQGAVGQAQGAAGGAQQKAKKKMGLFGKKSVCPNCGQPQDKTWDQCPFCMAGGSAPAPGPAAAPAAPAAPPAPMKTMAFMAGAAPGQVMQLLGWLVPIKGSNRGELFTLKPQTVIGKDPACDVVLGDPYMSSRHCTIKAANGVWVLEDHSTNGTFVNDKKIKTHELVDNDFLKFGNTLIKFKQL